MTYQELLQYGRRILKESDIGDADLDARYLLEWLTGYSYSYLLMHLQDDIDMMDNTRSVPSSDRLETDSLGSIRDRYEHVISLRSHHIPLQQITKEQVFMGYSFFVNEHVLIPRQDTEILVETVFDKIMERSSSGKKEAVGGQVRNAVRILDLCCGSGCIGISLSRLLQDKNLEHTMTLSDLSAEALLVAGRNAKRLDCQVDLIQSDLFENIEHTYSIIVSNPPYIKTDVIRTLAPEVRDHEPYMALDGKEDGLFYYRKIIQNLDDHIEGDGYVFFEIGFDQAEDLRKILVDHNYREIRVVKDLAGLDRVVYAHK